jgi:undecaprenyl-diphosphatase
MSPRKTAAKKTVPTAEHSVDHEPAFSASRKPWYVALLVMGLLLLVGTIIPAFSGSIWGWEQRLFEQINNIPAPSWVTNQLARPLSNAVWGMGFLVAALLLVPKYRLRAWQYAVAAGATYSVVFMLEHLIARGRPADFGFEVMLRAAQGGPGFPSGHVAVLTALILTLWPYIGWIWRVALLALIAAEAWSRLYLGLHWPLDVVGGVAVGMTVVAIIHLLPSRILRFFKISA